MARGRTLFHFSAADRPGTGLHRKFVDTPHAGEERSRLKYRADGTVDPSSAAVHFYTPGRRPEVRVSGGFLHTVRGQFNILNLDGPEYAAFKLQAKATGPALLAKIRKQFDGIERDGFVQLFRDVAPGQIASAEPVTPELRCTLRENGLPREEAPQFLPRSGPGREEAPGRPEHGGPPHHAEPGIFGPVAAQGVKALAIALLRGHHRDHVAGKQARPEPQVRRRDLPHRGEKGELPRTQRVRHLGSGAV